MKFGLQYCLLCIGFVLFAGCSTIQPYQPSSRYEKREAKSYSLNTKISVGVGMQLIRAFDYTVKLEGMGYLEPEASIYYSVKVPLNPLYNTVLVPGEKYLVAGTFFHRGEMMKVLMVRKEGDGPRAGLLVNGRNIGTEVGIWQTGLGGWSLGGGVKFSISPIGVPFKPYTAESIVPTEPYVNFDVLYTGRSGNQLTLLYREYAPDDGIRVSVSQAYNYDLGSSNEISLKNFKIRILQADNNTLVAEILSD